MLRQKQEAVLQAGEVGGALDRASPRTQELLKQVTQRGSGWVVNKVALLWLNIARYTSHLEATPTSHYQQP